MEIIELREEAELLQQLRQQFPHQQIRKFQADIANSIYQSLSAGSRSVLLEGPTGLGKGL